MRHAPAAVDVPAEALIEKEPITILCSDKGWIKAARGHLEDVGEVKYKEGDKGKFALKAETTDKLIVFATNGRCYTIACDKLPGGRGYGEPVRLMIDLGNDQDVVALFIHRPGTKLLVASSAGRGFVVAQDDVVASTRGGKQILNVSGDEEGAGACIVAGDTVAVIGENRRLLLFPLADVPEMARGRGVFLQRYKDGGSVGHQDLRLGRRAHLGYRRRGADRNRSPGLAGQARPGRAAAAEGLSALQPFFVNGRGH